MSPIQLIFNPDVTRYINQKAKIHSRIQHLMVEIGITNGCFVDSDDYHIAYEFENENEIFYVLVPYRIGKVALKGQYNKNKDSLVVTIDIKTGIVVVEDLSKMEDE